MNPVTLVRSFLTTDFASKHLSELKPPLVSHERDYNQVFIHALMLLATRQFYGLSPQDPEVGQGRN